MNPFFILAGQSLMAMMHSRLIDKLEAAYPGCLVKPCAVGGSLIKRWGKGYDCYEAMLATAHTIDRKKYAPGAVLFFQGQSDALTFYSSTVNQWSSGFIKMGQDFRYDIDVPDDFPIIYSTLGENPIVPDGFSQFGGWGNIRAQGVNLQAEGFIRGSAWGCGPYVNSKPFCHLPPAGLDLLSDRFINWTRANVPGSVQKPH